MTLLEQSVARPDASAPGPVARQARIRRHVSPVLVAMAVAGALHLVWWRFLATAGGDIAAQDAWAEFARLHPDSAYNLAWYGGMHPVSYSVLSPYLMAAVGVRPTMVLAGTLSAGLLARLLVTAQPLRGRRRWLPALYGAVALVGNAVSGRVTFALGTAFALGALCVVFAWPGSGDDASFWRTTRVRGARGALAAVTAAAATAASPVAGLFLGLVAASLWLGRRRAAAYALGLPPVVVVTLSAVLFPFSGEQPMSWVSVILPFVVGASVLLFAPRRWRTVRIGALVYLAAVVAAWVLPSPVGTNITRLGLIFGGVALVAAAVGPWRTSYLGLRFPARTGAVLLAMAITTSTIWQVATAARDAVSTAPSEAWSVDLDPLLAQLEMREAALGRVEVVPTRSHREAAAIAPHVALARGWNRQADAERNPLFYRDRPLTQEAYRRWLHRWAVGYVVLSTAAPDPAAVAETELIAKDLPYLRTVWSDENWTLFAVRNATPLVPPPAEVVTFDAAEITIRTPQSGRIVVRVAASPWLSLVDENGEALAPASPADACLSGLDSVDPEREKRHGAENWLVLHAPKPGTYRIAAPYKVPRGSSCVEVDR